MKMPSPFFSKTFLLCAGALALSAGTVSAVAPGDVYKDPQIDRQWQWFPEQGGINIAEVWDSGITGEGVVIGIIDQWVEPFHEDLAVSPYNTATDWMDADLSEGLSYDFMNPGYSPGQEDQPYPDLGHGTACAGMAAAIGGNDVGVVGAAPGATIAGLNASSTGGIFFSDSTKYWASGVKSNDGSYLGEALIGIKSCSFGSPFGIPNGSDLGIRRTAANNVIYCVAAGNDRGPREDGSTPTNTGWGTYTRDPYVITVASLGSTSYSSFSNCGAGVFIAAPGSQVYGTDRTGANGYSNTNYTSWSGTSAATPLVAGVIALGKEIQPDMDVRWAKHALAMSSGHGESANIAPNNNDVTGSWQKNKAGYYFNNNFGFGRIDAVGFVEQTRNILYTTTETLTTVETEDSFTKTETAGTTGTRKESFSFSSSLSQNVESVSVRVDFSAAAVASLKGETLKVTLYSPDNYSSVLVHGSTGDDPFTPGGVSLNWTPYYTFLTNAFWGSSYETGDWRVVVEYEADDGVNTENWVTVGKVDFRTGTAVYEDAENAQEIAVNQTVTLDTISVDSGEFTVAGTAKLEDSVLVNGGKFVLDENGTIEAYTDGIFGSSKGVKYVQTDGVAEFKGTATFKRGVTLSGGEMTLEKSINVGSGMTVSGDGKLTINGDSISVGTTLSVDGGEVVLAEKSSFASELKVLGGAVTMSDGSTAQKKISIGQAESEEQAAIAGTFSASGSVTASEGLVLDGGSVGNFAKDTTVSGGEITLVNGTLVWDGTLFVSEGINVSKGTLSSPLGVDNAVAIYNGKIENTGTLSIGANSRVTLGSGSEFTNANGTVYLDSNSILTLENGVGGVVGTFAGTLSGSGKLVLAQPDAFNGTLDDFSGTLALKDGCLKVGSAASLEMVSGATLEFSVSESVAETDWLTVSVESGGDVSFADGAKLIIDFTGTLGNQKEFVVMDWADDATVTGITALEKGSGIQLTVGGVAYDSEGWSFDVIDNKLMISLDMMFIDIKTGDQDVEVAGEDYVVKFSPSVTEYTGKITGTEGIVKSANNLDFKGDLSEFSSNVAIVSGAFSVLDDAKLGAAVFTVSDNGKLRVVGTREFSNTLKGNGFFSTSGTVTFTGNAGEFIGVSTVESGSLEIAKDATLGTGAFVIEANAVLKLNGDLSFGNETSGNGEVNVASGIISFMTNVGAGTLSVDQGATAKYSVAVDGAYAGKLSGNGNFETTTDFNFSGNAEAFTGTTTISGGTFNATVASTLGAGKYIVEKDAVLKLNGNSAFNGSAQGEGSVNVAAGIVEFTKNLGVSALSVEQGATAKMAIDAGGAYAGTISGGGSLATSKDFRFSGNAEGFFGATNVLGGTFSVDAGALLGSGDINVAGILELNGTRRITNALNGAGRVVLASGSEIAFARNVGVKELQVASGAVLKGSLLLTGSSSSALSVYASGSTSVLYLDGTVSLNNAYGETVDLGGGRVVLGDTATLKFSNEAFPLNEKVVVFENGVVAGDIVKFLGSNAELALLAQTQAVLYGRGDGLDVQIIEGASTAFGKMDMPDGTEAALAAIVGDWSAYSTPGFYENKTGIDMEDPLVAAMLSGSPAAREMALNVLPVNYAAMVAMTTAGYHSDVQSLSDRIEQRRYDAYSAAKPAEFFVQVSGTSMDAKNGKSDGVTFDYDTYGILAGVDYKLSASTLIGLSVAAEGGEAKLHGNGGKLEMKDSRLTGFIGKTFDDRFYVNGGVHAGSASFDIRRRTVYGDPRGDASIWNAGAFVEAGTLIPLTRELALMPYVGLSYLHSWVDDFEEKGSGATWNVDSFNADSLRARVGMDLSYSLAEVCRLSLGIAYSHDFMGEDVDIDAVSIDGETKLPTVKAKAMATDVFSISPTVDFSVNSVSSIYAGYTFSADSDSGTSHSANLGFRMKF